MPSRARDGGVAWCPEGGDSADGLEEATGAGSPRADVTVLLVDEHELTRAGLRTILRPDRGFLVVGEATDRRHAIDLAMVTRPDVVVMDVRMRGTDGLAATRELRDRAPDLRVLVLTTAGQDTDVDAALNAGVRGFCLKDAPLEDIQRAVRAVAAGDGWLDPTVCERVFRRFREDPATEPAAQEQLDLLTARERDVLTLLGRGLSNAEIADRLMVEEGTVKTHVHRVFTKLGVRDRPRAIVFAFDHGLVRPGRPPAD